MDVFGIIDGINARKNVLGLKNQQIADASQVPKSTVDRILRKETEDPRVQTLMAIADAVGYDFSAGSTLAIPDSANDSAYIRHIISMYEGQLAAMERNYNLVTAEKNRWIMTLAIIVGILGTGIITILLIDILNPTVGWFRREVGYYSNMVPAREALLSVWNWFKSL